MASYRDSRVTGPTPSRRRRRETVRRVDGAEGPPDRKQSLTARQNPLGRKPRGFCCWYCYTTVKLFDAGDTAFCRTPIAVTVKVMTLLRVRPGTFAVSRVGPTCTV